MGHIIAQTGILTEGTVKALADAGALTVVAIALVVAMLVLMVMCYAVYRGFMAVVNIQKETNAQTLLLKKSIDDTNTTSKETAEASLKQTSKAVEEVTRASHTLDMIERRLDDTSTKFSDAVDNFHESFPSAIKQLEEAVEKMEGIQTLIIQKSDDAGLRTRVEELILAIRQYAEREKKNEIAKTGEHPVVLAIVNPPVPSDGPNHLGTGDTGPSGT